MYNSYQQQKKELEERNFQQLAQLVEQNKILLDGQQEQNGLLMQI